MKLLLSVDVSDFFSLCFYKFLIVYQVMIIVAWRERVSSNVLFDEEVLRDVLSIFITAAILNFLRGTC